jgi:hypothetical protein
MSLRLFAGFALWLSLAGLPASHVGLKPFEWIAACAPLALLALRRAEVVFLAAILPLYLLRPDLASPRAQGTWGLWAQCVVVVAYLAMTLASGPPDRRRLSPATWDLGRSLAACAAVLMIAALAAPYVPTVAETLLRSYPAGAAAAAALLAAGCLALGAGLVLVYVAAPIEEAARRRP